MPRRTLVGGLVYHVLNRSNARVALFESEGDYAVFEKAVAEATAHEPLRILAYCVMPNHWHLVVWPEEGRDDRVPRFMHWLTLTHAKRWRAARETVGSGHVYGGRFKSFPVASDAHLFTVCRYVERNPLRAGLVSRAEEWRWSSLWLRTSGGAASALLSEWPVERPPDWMEHVNEPLTDDELDALRRCVRRGRPFGADRWVAKAVHRLALRHTLRPPGRPHKRKKKPERNEARNENETGFRF